MASAQEIDQHYKSYLQARYQNVGTSSFAYLFRYAFLWAGVWLGSVTLTDFFSAPNAQIFWTAAGALVIALTCIWPILQLRERSLRTVARTPPPAASSSLTSLLMRPFAGPPTRRIVAWYSIISIVSTITFSVLWEVRHTEVELGLFKSTVHLPHHLNERLVFLLIGNFWFAAFLGLWDVYTGRWNQPKWARDGETRGMRFEREVKSILASVPFMSAFFVVIFTLGWLTCRTQITRWIIQLSAGLLRPFLIRFARYRFDIGFGLICRLITLCINTGIILRLPKVFFDVNASQPLDFSPLTSKMKGTDAEKYLTTALYSNDDYLLNFTAFEWADRSHQSAKRKAILEDLSTKPTAWNNLWNGLISQIEKSLRILQTRNGKLLPSTPAQPVTAPPSIPTLSANKERAPAVRSLAGPGVAKQVDNATEKAEQAAITVSNAVASSWTAAKPGINTLVKRTTAALSPYTDGLVENNSTAQAVIKRAEEVKAGVEGMKQQMQTLQGKAIEVNEKAKSTIESKTWWRQQWNDNKSAWRAKNVASGIFVDTGDRIERVFARRWAEEEIESVLPRRKIDLGLIRTLSAFIAGSYDEDPYGQVQQNVPTALSSFAAYHSALLGLIDDIKSGAAQTESPIWQEEVDVVVREMIDPVRLAIENGVRRIQSTFGKSMKAFELSSGLTSWIDGIKDGDQQS